MLTYFFDKFSSWMIFEMLFLLNDGTVIETTEALQSATYWCWTSLVVSNCHSLGHGHLINSLTFYLVCHARSFLDFLVFSVFMYVFC